MIDDFQKHKAALESAFSGSPKSSGNSFTGFDRLLKADVSGIQDFIFHIKSGGASKTLKARSWYVQAICVMAEFLVKKAFLGKTEVRTLYNGGGSFYLFFKGFGKEDEENALKQLRSTISQSLWKENISLSLAVVEVSPAQIESRFDEVWEDIQKASSIEKLRAFDSFFEPFQAGYDLKKMAGQDDWKDLIKSLTSIKEPFKFSDELDCLGRPDQLLPKQLIRRFGLDWKFDDSPTVHPTENRLGLPIWKNDATFKKWKGIALESQDPDDEPEINGIISFHHLAKFAAERTGTEKLGILKLDVDKLGDNFKLLRSADSVERASSALKFFFEDHLLYQLAQKGQFDWHKTEEQLTGEGNIKRTHTIEKAAFFDNLYIIYSGGDDTFVLGAWDAVFEFSKTVRKAWEAFAENIKLTFSASLLMVGSHFPVVRFAQLADERLEEAKQQWGQKREEKGDRINVMGSNLFWPDWAEASEVAHEMRRFITEANEPRSVLARMQGAAERFERTLKSMREDQKDAPMPSVWLLLYSLRQSSHLPYLRKLSEAYQVDVLRRYKHEISRQANPSANKRGENRPQTLPTALRWAEFLTRNRTYPSANSTEIR